MITAWVVMVVAVHVSVVCFVPDVRKLFQLRWLLLIQAFDEVLFRVLAVMVLSVIVNPEGFEKLVFVGGEDVAEVPYALKAVAVRAKV